MTNQPQYPPQYPPPGPNWQPGAQPPPRPAYFNPQGPNWQPGPPPPPQPAQAYPPRPPGPPSFGPQPPRQVFQAPPPKKSHIGGLLIAVGVFLVLVTGITLATSKDAQEGFWEGYGSVVTHAPATTKAAPTETVAAPVSVPVPTVTKATDNIALLRLGWASMSAADQAGIRDLWRKYKDDPSLSQVYAKAFLKGVQESIPSVTLPEVITFLNWTLTH